MITCDTEIKTSNSYICFNTMFHMLHDLVVILYWSHYYHVAMLQDMGNFMLHSYVALLPFTSNSVRNKQNMRMFHMYVSGTMA